MPPSAFTPQGRVSLPTIWIILACLLTALPCVVFRYLPMTDLPQHEAIVSIIRHLHDPAYGFDRYYDWALDRTLYVFPYALAVGLAFIVPVKVALHITVMLGVGSFPLGVVLCLRALRRPLWLCLIHPKTWSGRHRVSERRLGRFYDTILVRNKSNSVRRQAYSGHTMSLASGSWQVFRPASHDLVAP